VLKEVEKRKNQFVAHFTNNGGDLGKKSLVELEKLKTLVNTQLRKMWVVIISLTLVSLYGYAYS
jgi:hypothetical protein